MKHSAHLHRIALATLALAPAALSQSGGFVPGELLLYSGSIGASGGGSTFAIARIDPLTGQASVLLDLFSGQSDHGAAAYDAFRDRVIFCASLASGQPKRAYLVDGSGATHDIGLGTRSLHAFAPARAGRIYYADNLSASSEPIKYIDADDVEHVLIDASGVQPFDLANSNVYRSMIYDAGTDALFIASSSGAANACAGGNSVGLTVRKVSLASDGSHAVGSITCGQFAADSTGGNTPVGFSRAPGGQIMLVIDTNPNTQQPRMVLLDPVTVAMTAYASNGTYAFAAATNAGTYSSARGEAVILDTGNNILRAFAQGTVGDGITITPSIQISSPGGSGEVASLFEIPIGECGTNNVSLYCTAKTTSGGCVPAITTIGGPSMSAPSGFTISASQIEPAKSGVFFYGLTGPLAGPFQGGWLCVKPPTRRTPVQSSGGAAACSGQYAFDFNAWLAGGNDPLVVAGTQINGQFWFRDPASASTTGLSAGVEFTPCP